MLLLARCVFRMWSGLARDRRDLVLENIALRHQLEVLARTRRRPALYQADRRLWSAFARFWPNWRKHIVIVQPETVVRWHRSAWRRYWTRRSRGARRGRPRIDAEVVAAIRRMTEENPRWGPHARAR